MDNFSNIKTYISSILDSMKRDKTVLKRDLFDHFIVNNITENSAVNHEPHQEKHTKYEARFFWPSSVQPEVFDLYGFMFNKKHYAYEKTNDKYLITENNVNIKIRKSELQIKPFIQQMGIITQFNKKQKVRFPIKVKKISSLLNKNLNFDSEVFKTPEDLMKSLSNFPDITWVDVRKERYIRKLGAHTTIEFALIEFQEKKWKTICIESKNIQKVLGLSLLIQQENAEKLSYNAFFCKHAN